MDTNGEIDAQTKYLLLKAYWNVKEAVRLQGTREPTYPIRNKYLETLLESISAECNSM